MPDLTNRFLEGNGSGYLSAGLPNITGTFNAPTGNGGVDSHFDISGQNGAFYGIFVSGKDAYTNSYNDYGYNSAGFDASLSNSIYGNSTTVQPASCKCYFYIKY